MLAQFDDAGGTRVLSYVQLDFLTSTSGCGTTTGTGVAVPINVVLSADYLLGMQVLSTTAAVIDPECSASNLRPSVDPSPVRAELTRLHATVR